MSQFRTVLSEAVVAVADPQSILEPSLLFPCNQFQHLDMSGSGLLTREEMSTHCIAQGTLLCGDLNGKASQKRGDTCIRIVIHFVVQQKLRPHCKATKLQ